MMNDLSSIALREKQNTLYSKPILPKHALCILLSLFLLALTVSLFILVVIHNAVFLISFILLFVLLLLLLIWNSLNSTHQAALTLFIASLPDCTLANAPDGQLVKLTGVVSCGNVSLESSYERATRCIYTSTLLYEYGQPGLKPVNSSSSCFQLNVAFSERFSTEFYVTDRNSGIRAIVKAGSGSKLIPLVKETEIVTTTRRCRVLSPPLKKWLRERNLPHEARRLRLNEGYVQEGSSVSVFGMLRKINDVLMVVQPPEVISTGCIWKRFLIPVDVDGLILWVPETVGTSLDSRS